MKKRHPFKKASEIKAGIIGYGPSFMMGKFHLNLMSDAGMQICAIADIDPERCKAGAADFPGIKTYSSAADMLAQSDVDLVTVITPHNTHAELAIQCMNAGRHVITEKPFAITTDECDAMIEARDRNKVMLSTFHNRHWDAWILTAKQKIESGMIGKIKHIDAHLGNYQMPGKWWRGSKSISGGIMYDWGAHFLEYSLQLLKGKIVEVSGFVQKGFWEPKSAWKEDCIEDEAFSVVRFDDGTCLKLMISSLEPNPKPGWLEVCGTTGSFIIKPGTWMAHCQEDSGPVLREGPVGDSETYRFYQNIVAHLLGKEELVITAEYARRPIHIMDWTARSAAANRTLLTKYS
ncbi:MAG: Gfo/Idh/MocA family oxidoreductase [Lentisphaeria bacterium]